MKEPGIQSFLQQGQETNKGSPSACGIVYTHRVPHSYLFLRSEMRLEIPALQ